MKNDRKTMIVEFIKNNINSMPYSNSDYEKMSDEISTKIDVPKSKVMEILKGLKISRLFYREGYIYEVATNQCGRRGILVDGDIETARSIFVEDSESDVVLMEKEVAEILGYGEICTHWEETKSVKLLAI